MARTALNFIIMEDYSQHTPWDEEEEKRSLFDIDATLDKLREARQGGLMHQNKILDSINVAIEKADDKVDMLSVPYYDMITDGQGTTSLIPRRAVVDMRQCHRCPCCFSTCEAITWGQ